MRIIPTLFLILFFVNYSYTQFSLGVNYNIDIYKPYTIETQDYLKINNQVSSSTYNIYLTNKVLENKNFIWRSGLAYKYIEQVVKEKIKAYYEPDYNNGTNTLKEESLDLQNKSQSFAFVNDFSFTLSNKSSITNEIGLSNEFYFLERYRSGYFYTNTEEKFENSNVNMYPMQPGFFKTFVSSTNLSLFYRFKWQSSEKFSLGTKISLGTNLYSDWDQFKKYAWLGVGLEVGFGKKKVKEVTD